MAKALTIGRSLLVYLILPNLLFAILGHFVYFIRPIVNVDYLLVGMVAPFVGNGAAILAYGLILMNELFINLAPVFHFQIADAVKWLPLIRYVHWTIWLPGTVAALVVSFGFAALAVRAAPLKQWRFANAAMLFVLCALISGADILNGTSFIQVPVHLSFANFNIAYSGVRRTYKSVAVIGEMDAKIVYQPLPATGGASGELIDRLRKDPHAKLGGRQIALIVVESMGLFLDPTLRDALWDPLRDPAIAARYNVRFGTAPFHGHTIDGELRELCGVLLQQYGEKDFPKCLPAYLRDEGYETSGFHGFTNLFYDRYRWYPFLGFDHILFAEDMRDQGITEKCGSGFRGICDTRVAELLHQQLLRGASGKPQFVYWMTLNSHLPLDSESAKDSSFDCSKYPITAKDDGACRHSRMVHLVLQSIAKVARDPALPPTEFIISGDHAPPFMDPETRVVYSPEEIPTIVLEPKR